jgi:histidine triad (HIT) family protein
MSRERLPITASGRIAVVSRSMDADCLVCREISGEIQVPGGPILEDELVFGFHVLDVEGTGEPVYLGHTMVSPKRHAPGLADVTDGEAAALGVAAARISRALVAEGADHVFSAVIGTGVLHLHVHLVPRYPDTPRDLPWTQVDEWDGAKKGDFGEIAELVARLRGHVERDPPARD